MTFADFKVSIASRVEPATLPPLLRSLWHDANGNWTQAHEIAQDVNSADGAWVHAYLHRKEGDDGNAAYWYHRAGRPAATDSLAAEWERLVTALLG